MIDTSVIRERFTAVEWDLNERSRRLLAAVEAKTAGYGGITAASQALRESHKCGTNFGLCANGLRNNFRQT
jgi:hypothetical protein